MYTKELKIAIAAVKKSEKTFRKYFGSKTNVRTKAGDYRNLVSEADTRIEDDIFKFISKHFPTHGMHGEETGATNGGRAFTWVLDPVDGTTNYLQGHPESVISLALLKHGKPVLGVIYAPILEELYTAVRGGGAKRNGKPIHVSHIKDIKSAFGSLGWAKNLPFAIKMFAAILPNILTIRIAGSGSLALCYVARGTYDFFLHRSGSPIWDVAAGQIILEESGGTILNSGNVQIAANKVLAARFKKIFK